MARRIGISNARPVQGCPPQPDERNRPYVASKLRGQVAWLANRAIWVIDTGLQFSHNDFGGRAGNSIIGFQGNGTTETPVTFPNSSENFGPFCCDDTGHGTAVASVAVGAMAGVAKGATVRGIQAYKSEADLIAAVDYVVQNKGAGPNIITMSVIVALSDSTSTPAFQAAVTAATNAGITVVASAGNEAAPACGYLPGAFANVITVGNSDKTDTPDPTSNYGPCLALFAPGVHVTIADTGGSASDGAACTTDSPSGSNSHYCTGSGTSYSAPTVAGIAALYLENNPTANFSTVRAALLKAAASGVIHDPRSGSGSPNLLASAWVPGNSDGQTVSPGNGFPPGNSNALNALAPILNLLLNGKK
jgi:subtilisin family serine protease